MRRVKNLNNTRCHGIENNFRNICDIRVHRRKWIYISRGFIGSVQKSKKFHLHSKQRRDYSANVMRGIASCDSATRAVIINPEQLLRA